MFYLKVITLNFKLYRVGLVCYNGYYLLLCSVFSFFRKKAKLVRKQRCKFKAFFFFLGSETFSHFCGELFQYTQFGQIVPYRIYNFLKIQSWCNIMSSLSCHKFSSFFLARRYIYPIQGIFFPSLQVCHLIKTWCNKRSSLSCP